jgi:hypothetical protein
MSDLRVLVDLIARAPIPDRHPIDINTIGVAKIVQII